MCNLKRRNARRWDRSERARARARAVKLQRQLAAVNDEALGVWARPEALEEVCA